MKKFNGDLKDWLHFWGLFKQINKDKNLENQEKFQYLIQSTVSASRARDVVESYPPTSENYAKAVAALQTRFGRENLLIEMYTRELLSLVISNISTATSFVLSNSYDKLECQLRSLQSLDVTSDKYASMLHPLVELCLPEDLLRICCRRCKHRREIGEVDVIHPYRSGNEEKVTLAKGGVVKRKTGGSGKSVPTAATLVSQDKKVFSCIFL